MAYSKKKEETKKLKSNRVDVECEQTIDNDLTITQITFYPINKGGLACKCNVVINDLLVLANILITDKGYVNIPADVYKNKDDENVYNKHYFFIKKGIPKDFGDYILSEFKANVK